MSSLNVFNGNGAHFASVAISRRRRKYERCSCGKRLFPDGPVEMGAPVERRIASGATGSFHLGLVLF